MATNTKFDKSVKYFMIAGSIIVLFTVIFIQIWAAYYSVFNADDFSVAVSMRPYGDSAWEYVLACFRYVKRTYLNWQGTYSSMFVWTIVNPLNEFGLPQLRAIMVLNALLYFFSLLFFIFVFFNSVVKDHYHIKLFFSACAVFMIINSRAYPEIFFWFNGAGTYNFPIICLFISLGFFILSNTKDKNRILYAVLASLFSIGSQGGSLAIGGVGCYLILVLCFWFWIRSKKFSAMNLVVAIIYFLGAFINGIAPGNYIRHELYEEGLHPIASVGWTIREYFREMMLLVTNAQFMVIFLLLILCGAALYMKLQSDIKIYTVMSLLLLAAPAAAVFPVILGCGEDVDIPNRALFIINSVMVLACLNLAVTAGYWIAVFMHKKALKPGRLLCPLAVLLLVLLFDVFIISDVRDTVMIRTLSNLYHGKIQEYYADCKDIYEYLAQSSEADVVIEDYPERIEGFGAFQLYSDPNEWVNTRVADYYYKNSVRTTG